MKLFDYSGSIADQCRGLLANTEELKLTENERHRLNFLAREDPPAPLLYNSDRTLIERLKTKHRYVFHKRNRELKRR